MKKIIILITLLLSSIAPLLAQSCTAKAPAKVGINQQFQYVVTLDQKGNVTATDFGNFSKVGGPSVSSSQSFSFVNGQQTSSYTHTNMVFSWMIFLRKIDILSMVFSDFLLNKSRLIASNSVPNFSTNKKVSFIMRYSTLYKIPSLVPPICSSSSISSGSILVRLNKSCTT